MGPDAYVQLVEGSGLLVEKKIDFSSALIGLLDKAESLLGAAQIGLLVGQAEGDQLGQAAFALQCARQMIGRGDLGYWCFTP